MQVFKCMFDGQFHLIQFPRISTDIFFFLKKFDLKSIWDVKELQVFVLYRTFDSLSVSKSGLIHEAFPRVYSCLLKCISSDFLCNQGHTNWNTMSEVFVYFFILRHFYSLFQPAVVCQYFSWLNFAYILWSGIQSLMILAWLHYFESTCSQPLCCLDSWDQILCIAYIS